MHIDAARDALKNGDIIKTMEAVNSIDIILFNVAPSLKDED
jgi:hypothetical protein